MVPIGMSPATLQQRRPGFGGAEGVGAADGIAVHGGAVEFGKVAGETISRGKDPAQSER